MKRYDVIFFDLDHTLVDTRGQYALGLARATQELYGAEVPVGFAAKFMEHHEALWPLYDRRAITMQELRRERFLRAWKSFGIDKSEAEADQFQAVYDATFEDTLHPFPGAVEMVAALAQTHRLGIITNGSPDLQWRKLGIAGLQAYFPKEAVIISEAVGKAKPHPSVYQAACDALQVAKEDALMIGDNFISDVQGARNFEMDAIWFAPDLQEPIASVECAYGERPLTRPDEVLETISQLEQTR
ncbi:HAD family hydrolase [Alicyclobacillus cycloheptanicus]|uniref:Hydrolase of the HAD superfamily n=1 Tax=Alicyclobacillus cycloheptanicus TaxID=1457 RepID=A0ABT9XFW2_9BACL|nr:HAD family hydrolase [Alicyclobacillus cycloheptanicus]MDQ0189165.1 putative hydrolase of the HAD superfamily [Alicyclobacillus cycloheptanicus]WDM00356.1 HAD family hydrolase [Alicyclobacillus cycloheptanicus]